MPIHVRACSRVCVYMRVERMVEPWRSGMCVCGAHRPVSHDPSPNQPSPPPTTNQTYRTFERMTSFCKTKVPPEMWEELRPIKEDDEAVKNWGILYMTKLCRWVYFLWGVLECV